MFAKACEKAMQYTHPLVQNIRTVDGDLQSQYGTYFFINKQGWAVTAAHVFNVMMKFQYDQKHIQEINQINEKNKAEGKPESAMMDPKWITHHSFWFGADPIRLSQVHLVSNADLAIFKLDNVPEAFLKETAVFGDVSKLRPGTSLCKLGYPFIANKPDFKDGNFVMKAGNIAPFPVDGIFTRMATDIIDQEKKIAIRYIETSTPGLLGQSGGPTFDINGIVYAIQSRTVHLPLGFTPKVNEGDKVTTAHQFMNVGNGIPVDILIQVLVDRKIPFETVNQDSDGSTYVIR